MSIIIEDMTMPECCMKCPMAAGYGCGYTGVAMATKDMKSGRHEDCPLEEADDGWIPVEDRPPDNNTDFLLQFKSNMGVGFYEDGDWAINTGEGIYSLVGYNEEKPIAWRPLPPAYEPKEDK